jgi:glycosyltransferase involved in cell wall biosynthesis
LIGKAHGYFAYTEGVKEYLAKQGIPRQRIVTVNNTIDINYQRRFFCKYVTEAQSIKQKLGLAGKTVLLFVGRKTKNKRIEFLLEAFSVLQELDKSFHLLLVGSGGKTNILYPSNITNIGPLTALDKLAPVYVVSDLFTIPGAVGLGPLQALCYDLPVVTIAAETHGPEIDYLGPENSIILPKHSTPRDYAEALVRLFQDGERMRQLKLGIWPSIRHLTIENMARNFANGVDKLLQK